MLELIAFVLLIYWALAFVLVAFGAWSIWTLIIGLIMGFVYVMFTE